MTIYRQKGKCVLNNGICTGIIDGDWKVPYVPGDVTNASTYDFPVVYKFLHDIDLNLLIDGDPSQGQPIVTAVRELADQGVSGITGDCGFLIHYQAQAAKAVNIPVFLSSLLQLPLIDAVLDKRRPIGIIAAIESSLNDDVISKTGYSGQRKLIVRGLQDLPEWASCLLTPSERVDTDKTKAEVVQLCQQMQQEQPDMGALLFECSMLPPYASAAQSATGLPVFDFVSMINYFQRASFRKRFSGYY